ncbi:MAG: ATPase domain-containing protein [Candidatus Diapherotrites archaeon]
MENYIEKILNAFKSKNALKNIQENPEETTAGKIPKKRPKIDKTFDIPKTIEIMPIRVDKFDGLIKDGGLERGSTTLISGGTGTGKTTFALQSMYYSALKGEKGIFISFEEEPAKIKQHMLKNFGWDFYKLEKQGVFAFLKLDPAKIARTVEGKIAEKSGSLKIKIQNIELPFKPDRICLDSLSALSIAFEDEDNYRKYIRELFEFLESYNSVNLVIAETQQNPKIYSKTGVEEFLADAVVVLYNVKHEGFRKNALEILKLRSSEHVKKMVPYKIGSSGIEINTDKNKF